MDGVEQINRKRPIFAHDRKVSTVTSNQHWCSDGFDIPYENKENVRAILI